LNESVLICLRISARVNSKNRPVWFSKDACVASLARAAATARASGMTITSLVFVDSIAGELPDGLQALINNFDRILSIKGGSSRRSWKAQLDFLRKDPASTSHDLIYLVEDDHLHAPEAIACLREMPGEYGLLYSISKMPSKILREQKYAWVETVRGVSSFVVTRRAFKADFHVLRFMSNGGAGWDALTWRVLRGQSRLTFREILWPLSSDSPYPSKLSAKAWWQVAWRGLSSGWSSVRVRKVIGATNPSMATHCEVGWIAEGTDWPLVAELNTQG
jgi:hypothetical protein